MNKIGFTRNDTGFAIQFPNGYGLSVQWSAHHMCSNYLTDRQQVVIGDNRDPHSNTAECCELTPSGLSKVHGHCSPEHVLKLMRKMARKPTAEERAMARQCQIENQQRLSTREGWTAELDRRNEKRNT